ncbi:MULTISPECIES: hypothetical protein [unclassified Sulfitobacter]|uniref:hypothetical protein n=1 Tax=unclassified Sulfitobacter TaxID=196795 RepID=UPI0007C24308|nr:MULTISPECIES: hypothetical protein [unclassified Sulfitobacter]KZX96351.1 hypothetical protein A3720_20175 [Sulfitobacter sp. HI0021]KZY04214.1 hypothetical protein A3722_19505 [Sulfitobacter sp. HI0027]KZZ03079.1 hypothetical protein A3747_13295 [Sulfitobacter sp. HI0076]
MTLKVIDPVTVANANLVSHNLSDPNAEWAAGTTFASGAVVKVSADKRLYESVIANNSGNIPSETIGTAWIDRGAMLPWRAFDGGPSSIVTRTGQIDVRFSLSALLRGVALINVSASQARVTVYSGSDVTYDKTLNSADTSEIVDYVTLFTMPLEVVDLGIIDDIAAGPGNEVRVRVGQAGETVSVGEIIFGDVREFGIAVSGLSSELTDYSVETIDPFGNATIVERGYTFDRDYPVVIRNGDGGRMERALARLRARRGLYYVNAELANKWGVATYGRLTKLTRTADSNGYSDLNVTVEGRL